MIPADITEKGGPSVVEEEKTVIIKGRGKVRCMKWNKCHYLTTEDSLLPLPPG